MSLLFLESADFNIQNSERGKILCHSIQGLSLIFFYSDDCVYCQSIIPMYKKLPSLISGCQFGFLHVNENMNCINQSQQTITKIDVVPFFILYWCGKPLYQYVGEMSPKAISTFIRDAISNLRNVHQNPANVRQRVNAIPAYTIGRPIKGFTKIKYKDYNIAYNEQNQQ